MGGPEWLVQWDGDSELRAGVMDLCDPRDSLEVVHCAQG